MQPLTFACKVWTPEDRYAQEDLVNYCISNGLNLSIAELADSRKSFTVYPPLGRGNVNAFAKLKAHLIAEEHNRR